MLVILGCGSIGSRLARAALDDRYDAPAARDQIAEAGGRHGLQQGVLVWVMEVKGGAVQGSFISDLLDGDVGEFLASQ